MRKKWKSRFDLFNSDSLIYFRSWTVHWKKRTFPTSFTQFLTIFRLSFVTSTNLRLLCPNSLIAISHFLMPYEYFLNIVKICFVSLSTKSAHFLFSLHKMLYFDPSFDWGVPHIFSLSSVCDNSKHFLSCFANEFPSNANLYR